MKNLIAQSANGGLFEIPPQKETTARFTPPILEILFGTGREDVRDNGDDLLELSWEKF